MYPPSITIYSFASNFRHAYYIDFHVCTCFRLSLWAPLHVCVGLSHHQALFEMDGLTLIYIYISRSMKIKRFWNSWNLSSRTVLTRGFWVYVSLQGLVVWYISLGMDYYVGLLMITFVLLYQLVVVVVWMWYLVIYIIVLWVATWAIRNCWKQFQNVFIGVVCMIV